MKDLTPPHRGPTPLVLDPPRRAGSSRLDAPKARAAVPALRMPGLPGFLGGAGWGLPLGENNSFHKIVFMLTHGMFIIVIPK